MADLAGKTKEICRILEIKPARSKGQNFLISERVYDDIIKAAEIGSSDEVLEVGPGLGFLTVRLAAKAKRVVAVELDDKLAAYLQTGFGVASQDKVKIINQDILRFNPQTEFSNTYKIVANLPYNITSIFLRTFLSSSYKPDSIVLMLQKEVTARMVAQPPDMSLLAVSVQHYAEPEIIRPVRAEYFWPAPEVDSAVIRLKIKPPVFSAADDKRFFRLVKAGFSAKRKMLKNNLSGGLLIEQADVVSALKSVGINDKERAENLSLTNWYQLFAALSKFMV